MHEVIPQFSLDFQGECTTLASAMHLLPNVILDDMKELLDDMTEEQLHEMDSQKQYEFQLKAYKSKKHPFAIFFVSATIETKDVINWQEYYISRTRRHWDFDQVRAVAVKLYLNDEVPDIDDGILEVLEVDVPAEDYDLIAQSITGKKSQGIDVEELYELCLAYEHGED